MRDSGLLSDVQSILEGADYQQYWPVGLREVFDILAVRQDDKLLLKVLSNIDSLRRDRAEDMLGFGAAFGADPYLVSEKSNTERMQDDVQYSRYSVSCITPKTLERVVSGQKVYKFTERGQTMVSLDSSELRKLRETRGLTQDDVADKIGVSKQSIYRYESHGHAEETAANKLVVFFGNSILSETKARRSTSSYSGKYPEIYRALRNIDPDARGLHNFLDFAVEERPILTPLARSERELRSKRRTTKSLEEITDCKTVFISEIKCRSIPTITQKKLKSLSTKDELEEIAE